MNIKNTINKAPYTVIIFCTTLTAGGDPFSDDYYWEAYQDLLFALKDRGLRAYFATDNNTYRGDGLFDVVYSIDERTTLEHLKPIRGVHADIVFDRGNFRGNGVLTINPELLRIIGGNKIEMYKHFAHLQPYSIVCNNKTDVINAFQTAEGEKIVVKEPDGDGGNEVYIGNKQDIFAALPARFPLLVQEFLDTSAGIPGVVSGVHDVRLKICGGEIIGYFVRQAKKGSYHSNVAQGGNTIFLDVAKVPAEIAQIARTIDQMFIYSPRFYAIDFMLTPQGWKMVELNSRLGLSRVTDGKEAQKTLAKLADYFVKVCHEQADEHSKL